MQNVSGGVAVLDPDTDGDLFTACRRAMSARARLDALLWEALGAPGMALTQVHQICELARSGDLDGGEAALTTLRERRQ